MNALSLAYNNKKNQENIASWTDDPFNLKGGFTGVSIVPKINHHQRSLNDYTQELVYNHAQPIDDGYVINLDSLPMPSQLELARLYIETIDREIEWACYGEDQTLNSDFLCAILAMLKDNTPNAQANFAQITTSNILKYYKNTLQELLDIACQDYFLNEMSNGGYSSEIDNEHGDISWSR